MSYRRIKGYEDRYLIYENGLVKSISRAITLKNGKTRNLIGKLISSRIDRAGYFTLRLTKDGKTKTHYLHRLIAQNFVPNEHGYPQVNHINGIKTDNRPENLEWVNNSQNTLHAYKHNLSSNQGQNHIFSCSIVDKTTGITFPTIKSFCNHYNICYSTARNIFNGYTRPTKAFPDLQILSKFVNRFYRACG